MLISIRQMPASVGADVPLYRVNFQERPGARPITAPLLRGEEGLRSFLTSKLAQTKITAARTLAQISAKPYEVHCLEDIRINSTDLTVVIKAMDEAERQRVDALTA